MLLSKNENLTTENSPSALKWILAARPKTLIAGISPVLIGASLSGIVSWRLFFWTLAFSLLIQIGTNFANDYFDFLSGADLERVGPKRAVASGWIAPSSMKRAWQLVFAAAFCVSLPLVQACGLWSLCFVLSSIAFGILYTGGPKPFGYMGLGELFVLPYFGPIAVCGTYFVQCHAIEPIVVWLSLSPGLLSTAILVANNLRDQETDAKANKNTLVVRFGKTFGAWEYALCVAGPLMIPAVFGLYAPLLLAPLAFVLIRRAFTNEVEPLLAQTAALLIAFTALFCYAIARV